MKKLSEYIREQERDAAKHEELRLGQLRAWIDELDQHEPAKNERAKEIRATVREGHVVMLGVACDLCATELVQPDPRVALAVLPPRVTVACPACGWEGSLPKAWVPHG